MNYFHVNSIDMYCILRMSIQMIRYLTFMKQIFLRFGESGSTFQFDYLFSHTYIFVIKLFSYIPNSTWKQTFSFYFQCCHDWFTAGQQPVYNVYNFYKFVLKHSHSVCTIRTICPPSLYNWCAALYKAECHYCWPSLPLSCACFTYFTDSSKSSIVTDYKLFNLKTNIFCRKWNKLLFNTRLDLKVFFNDFIKTFSLDWMVLE